MEVLRKLLWPVSLVYAAVVWLRNLGYDRGWFPSEHFSTPVLCIGNLSLGGTGKTPMVEWILSRMPGQGVAVLSRGYRRKSRGFVLAGPDPSADILGDEPAQISRKFPGVAVAVDANRQRGIRRLQQLVNPALILLDDGFQHRRVRPDGSILLTAWDALYTDQGYLPSGDLRDHKSQARRADIIAVTKCPELPGTEARKRIRRKLRPDPGQQVVFASLAYSHIRDQSGQVVQKEALVRGPVTLVTGIARPGPLLRHLEKLGIRFEHLDYPDHHHFTEKEIEWLRGRPQILTTEKDAARLQGRLSDYWVIGVSHRFGREDEQLLMDFITSL